MGYFYIRKSKKQEVEAYFVGGHMTIGSGRASPVVV